MSTRLDLPPASPTDEVAAAADGAAERAAARRGGEPPTRSTRPPAPARAHAARRAPRHTGTQCHATGRFRRLQIERMPGYDRGSDGPAGGPTRSGPVRRRAPVQLVAPRSDRRPDAESPRRGGRPASPRAAAQCRPRDPEPASTSSVAGAHLQIAVTSVGGDAGSIMLVDESGEFLRIAAADGLPEWCRKRPASAR